MLNNINSNDGVVNSSLLKQSEISAVERRVNNNPYKVDSLLVDESEISKEAKLLYERDLEIQKYKNMVLESLDQGDETKEIIDLMTSGKYQITDEQLAESLIDDEDLIKYLF